MFNTNKFEQSPTHPTHFDTTRWTSKIYNIQFGQVAVVQRQPEQEAAFALSAWGLSQRLRALLADFDDTQIRDSAEWLTLQQNALVADVLEQMQYSLQAAPPLEHLFISIDAELFLPRGLKMIVTCVTNIVPNGSPSDGLDKFVALLDPGEVQSYIVERKGTSVPMWGERIH